jgi:hypothetical protein
MPAPIDNATGGGRPDAVRHRLFRSSSSVAARRRTTPTSIVSPASFITSAQPDGPRRPWRHLLIPALLLPSLATLLRVLPGFVPPSSPLSTLRRQRLVDRTFYRARLDYRQTIDRLSALLSTLLETPEIVSQVTAAVTDAMQLESTAICLFADGDEDPVIWVREAQGRLVRRTADPALQHLADALTVPDGNGGAATARITCANDDAPCRRWAQLALPLRIRSTTACPPGASFGHA